LRLSCKYPTAIEKSGGAITDGGLNTAATKAESRAKSKAKSYEPA
jgi:hypothetical protein